jgi:hypothetical protein
MDLSYSKALKREDENLYVQFQTIQIDKLIDNSDFQGAFILLVTTLFRLNENEREKNNLIIYYRDFIFNKYPQLKRS